MMDLSFVFDFSLKEENSSKQSHSSKRNSLVHGCIVTCKDMVAPKDPAKKFDKVFQIKVAC